jgi:hypothetical protein
MANVGGFMKGLLLLSTACFAEQDFYGIQMRNELWAKNLVLGEGPRANPEDLRGGPILNHKVRAEASLKPVADGHLDFQVNVINESIFPISSDYRYRDFFIYTDDGRKYPLVDMEDDTRLDLIAPHSSLTFSPSLGNFEIKNDNVLMIGCSFDLGRTEIFLFPWAMKEKINQLTSPVYSSAVPEVVAAPSMSSRKIYKTKEENLKPPVGSAKPSPAPAARRLEQAIKNFVYTPSSHKVTPDVSVPKEAETPPATRAVSAEARGFEPRVLDYDKTYNFVTVNLGLEDGLQQNMVITILRDGKTVAKARVKQLREAVAAALLLPGTIQTEVRPGDKVSLV